MKIQNNMKREIKMQRWLQKMGGFAAALALTGSAWAGGVIQSITSGTQSGEIIVKVEMSEPLTQQPQGFVIQNPARIALDLPGVTNGMKRSLVDLSQGNLRSVAIAQSNDRTRLVLNLGSATAYTTEVSGNTLYVRLAGSGSSQAAAQPQPIFSPQTAGNQSSTRAPVVAAHGNDLKNIDFRTSVDGSGALIVSLPSDQTPVNVGQQGGSIVVDVMQTNLPASLRRRLDVSDFKTPMQSITAEQVGANVRLTVVPSGNWDQSAYQAGNQFVLELQPVKEDPNKLIEGRGYKGDRLTLNFQNIDVRALLQVIADFTDFNVVTSDSVSGNLTLRLKDVPWDQALEIILQAKGLSSDKNGNVLWIAPRDEIRLMQTERLRSVQERETLEPLRTQIFQLNYAKSEAVMAAVNIGEKRGSSPGGQAMALLSERGSVIVDPRTNKLIVTDVPSRLENLAAVIDQIDVPVRQVQIEARIVEASDGWGRSLGTRLTGVGSKSHRDGFDRWVAGGSAPKNDDDDDDDDDDDEKDIYGLRGKENNFFNLPAGALGGINPGFFSFRFNARAGRFLQLELQALETENYGRNIASPRLMTADSVTASVEQGVQIPYQEASSSGATSTSFKDANLKLEVTPRITPDGNVDLKINVSQDSVGEDTINGPAINTKRVNTQVTIENGGTVVIGGIFTQSESSLKTKIPLLGDIPLIGQFFRSTKKTNRRTELLIFITPSIIDDGFNRGSSSGINLGGNL